MSTTIDPRRPARPGAPRPAGDHWARRPRGASLRAVSARSADDPRSVPPALASATSVGAAGGDVEVVVRGVRDRQHLNGLIDALGRARGVNGIAIRGYEAPDAPVLTVSIARGIQLAGEIRRRFGAGIATSEQVGTRVEVTLAAPGTVSGHPRRPTATASRPGSPTRRPAGAARSRPWAQPGAGGAWAPPRPADPAPPGPAAGPPPVPEPSAVPGPGPTAPASSLLDALGAEADLSILHIGPDLVVRAAHGGLHDRSIRLRDGVVGRPLDEVLPPTTYVGLADLARDALHGRPGEVEVRSASSSRRYRITVRPLVDADRVTGCMTVTRDVTRQHQDAQLLGELTDVFETALDRAPTGQALLSPTGRWLRVNDALGGLLRRYEDDLLGTDVLDTTHPEDRDREAALLREVQAGHADGYELEKRVLRGDGTTLRVYARMSPIRTVEGAVRGFVAHVVDADRWGPPA